MQIFSCSDDWDQLFHNGNIEQGHEYNMEMKGLGTVHSLHVFDYRPRPKWGWRVEGGVDQPQVPWTGARIPDPCRCLCATLYVWYRASLHTADVNV